MNPINFSSYPPPPGLPALQQLVRPEQIPKLVHIPEEKKATYMQGVSALWEQIKNRPSESPEYQNAYKKLNEFSETLKRSMNRMGAAQNGSRPTSQGQPVADVRPPTTQQPNQVPSGQPREQQFSQKVLDRVRQQTFLTPPEIIAQGPQRAQLWQKQSKHSYAVYLQKYETAQIKLQELAGLQQNKEGKAISQQDAQHLLNFKNQYQQMSQEAQEHLKKFTAQQNSIRATQAKAGNAGNAGASAVEAARIQTSVAPATDHSTSTLELPTSHTSTSANTMSDHQGQPHTVNSALDAARNHPNSAGRPEPAMGNSGSAGQAPGNVAASTQAADGQGAAEHSQSHLNVNTTSSATPQYHSPQTTNPAISAAQGPQPLSHQAAITQSAQKYTQHNYQNPVTQPTSHAHPQMSGRDPQNTNHKMPITKDLKVPQPQPVVMGPARPTLTGGPSNGAMGSMGQPAIQKHPGYVLEGDGERVLGRKKLEELVRQVTGGIDGEDGETLTAAAEETLLDVADDFVDQVMTAACKLAKLRSSQTLELRDIQLVLERNYNIRIPGYASDELRTVKKVQPTHGWTQKLAAVQAAKVTGGKGDM
ncbi:MAG: hypothetical protein LQ344_000561 [Seirophora lacunosa]|nr:MAG: hypothetical protein LQ344_000561 [Seirophora lacunosa]